MISMTTAEDLQRFWDERDRKARLLEQELVEVRADMEACERLLSRYRPGSNAASEPVLFHNHVHPSRLTDSPTQMEAFKRIALDSDGIVRVSEASRLVHSAGLSKGKASSIASSIPKKFLESDEWEYVEPGTYRLVTYMSTDPDAAEEKSEDAEAEDLHFAVEFAPSSNDTTDAA
jgi:hypothetical protein